MNTSDIIQQIIPHLKVIPDHQGHAFAPSNIALIKYWGKRDLPLNLPVTGSLSISLADKGTTTTIRWHDQADSFTLNGEGVDANSAFAQRLTAFLNYFRPDGHYFLVETHSNIPIAAGLASSASGFAALVMALDQLFQWSLPTEQLSVLARLGSGSACRSLWHGFVKWQVGEQSNGMDSYAYPLTAQWHDLRVGLLIISSQRKTISSREAMNNTVETSSKYQQWPARTAQAMQSLEHALDTQDFDLLGRTAENHALLMHETMEDATPPVSYSAEATHALRAQVWQLRQQEHAVYFTQDAGPNLKLLFLASDTAIVQEHFPEVEIIRPFSGTALA